MDFGIIDVSTCEPVSNVLVDIWHANTTGEPDLLGLVNCSQAHSSIYVKATMLDTLTPTRILFGRAPRRTESARDS